MFVHVVADYGQNDLAFAEVAQRLALHLPECRLVYTAVPPFATLAAGFCAAQLALNPGPPLAVFQNVAPRWDDRAARRDNDGERLVCARLADGRIVVGPNSGYAFSFLASAAQELHFVGVASAGSQFRSRDLFAEAFAALVDGSEDLLGEAVPEQAVPPPPESCVAYVDGYGNIKTTIMSGSDLTPGVTVGVRIGSIERDALVAGGGFAVPDGVLAFAPGSSGWRLPDGREIRFRELFLRGGSAWESFGRPRVESRVSLSVKVA
jgi:hypothetical protein